MTERRTQTDKFHKENSKRFDGITKTLKAQDVVLKTLVKNNQDHVESDADFQKDILAFQVDTNKILKDLGELIPIVREKLLPAYQKEMDRERAYQIISQDREKYGDWGKFVLVIVGILGAIFTGIKIFIK